MNDGLRHYEMMANKYHSFLSSTTRLNRHTYQPNNDPWCHGDPRLLEQIAKKPKKKQPVEAHQLYVTGPAKIGHVG